MHLISSVLEPIYSVAKLSLNPNPELDRPRFSIPKVLLNLTLERLALGVSRHQYLGCMEFLQALEGLNLRSRHRKYNPPVLQAGVQAYPITRFNASDWWCYAYRCVLGERVRRRRRAWSWSHIKATRDQMREYRRLYAKKLLLPSGILTPIVLQNGLDECEHELSVFNIILMRQYAEWDAEKLRAEDERQRAEQAKQKKGWVSWMTAGYVGGGGASSSATQQHDGEGALMQKMHEAMNPDEQKRLYNAIGYSENAVVAIYPKSFIENLVEFELGRFDNYNMNPTVCWEKRERIFQNLLTWRPSLNRYV